MSFLDACLPLFGDVHWVLDFIADGCVQSVIGALKGATSTSNRGTGYIISHRSWTIVVETWIVRTLVPAWSPVILYV